MNLFRKLGPESELTPAQAFSLLWFATLIYAAIYAGRLLSGVLP